MFFFSIDAFHLLIEGKRKHTSPTARSSGLYSGPGLNCSCYDLDLVSHSNRRALYNALFFYPSMAEWLPVPLDIELEVPLRLQRIALEYATLCGWSSGCLAFSRGWVFFFFFSRLHCHVWQIVIVRGGKTLSTLVSCLMKKVTPVPPYCTESPVHSTMTVAAAADNSVAPLSPPHFSPAKKQKV